jgi:Flp pilus assembly pilin Flp
MWPGDSIPQPLAVLPISVVRRGTSPSAQGNASRDHPTEGHADARAGRCSEGLTRSARPSSMKVVKKIVTFTNLVAYFRARFGVEEGQTMAEYGVVLAVITGLIVVALLALSGAISAALDTVRGYL